MIQGLQLSGDRQWLTTNSELEVRRWKLDPRQEFAVNRKTSLYQASLSSDGKLLATAPNTGIELWDLSGKKESAKENSAGCCMHDRAPQAVVAACHANHLPFDGWRKALLD